MNEDFQTDDFSEELCNIQIDQGFYYLVEKLASKYSQTVQGVILELVLSDEGQTQVKNYPRDVTGQTIYVSVPIPHQILATLEYTHQNLDVYVLSLLERAIYTEKAQDLAEEWNISLEATINVAISMTYRSVLSR